MNLAPIMADEKNVGSALAKELDKQIRAYFAFVLQEDSEDFLIVYWVACYLAPVQKLMLSSHQVERVKQYLRGMLWYFVRLIHENKFSKREPGWQKIRPSSSQLRSWAK